MTTPPLLNQVYRRQAELMPDFRLPKISFNRNAGMMETNRMPFCWIFSLGFHVLAGSIFFLWHQQTKMNFPVLSDIEFMDIETAAEAADLPFQAPEKQPVEKIVMTNNPPDMTKIALIPAKQQNDFLLEAAAQNERRIAPAETFPAEQLALKKGMAGNRPEIRLNLPNSSAGALKETDSRISGRNLPVPSAKEPPLAIEEIGRFAAARPKMPSAVLPSRVSMPALNTRGIAEKHGPGSAGQGQAALLENALSGKKKIVEVSGPIAKRKIAKFTLPDYPSWARKQGITAEMSIEFYVAPDGTVRKKMRLTRTSGYHELDRRAQEALIAWLFEKIAGPHDQLGVVTFRYVLE
ncbi:MAG: TonB family protein [Elusimicrobia bacterium]|nr:TonB family protein [Elusimicrobiota bacterium]